MMIEPVTHPHPVWRDRADHIVEVQLDHGLAGGREQLWARRVGADEVEICCIPFFVYDLSLGDIALIDDENLVQRVARRSGRYVFRIIVDDHEHNVAIADRLHEAGLLWEWHDPGYASIDAPGLAEAEELSGWLLELQELGRLRYETGRS